MADYGEDLAIIVRYDGTKEQFDAVKSNYLGKVVFIYGSKDEVENQKNLVQAIWVSNESGGRYLDMANVDTIKNGLTHIAGLATEGIVKTLNGGANGINFKGANGISITFNPSNATDNDGVPYWNVEVNGAGLIGKTGDAGTEGTIYGAKAYAEQIGNGIRGTDRDSSEALTIYGTRAYIDDTAENLIGTDDDNETSATITGAKMYAEKAAGEAKAEAVAGAKEAVYDNLFGTNTPGYNTKIRTSHLPDVILGQLKFGGTIGNAGTNTGANRNIKVTPSSDYLSQFPNTSSNGFPVDEGNFLANNRQGWYFIVAKPNLEITPNPSIGDFFWNPTPQSPGTEYKIGDWFLSNGIEWVKIDNTDAVSLVAGLSGDIPAATLADRLSSNEWAGENALLKKSEFDTTLGDVVKSVEVETDSEEYMSATNNNGAVTLGVTTEDITSEDAKTDGLATVADIRAYLKARLSVKVVSSN